MGRKTRLHNTDNNPGVRPPLKVELSEKNKKLRMAAIIGFLAIALIAFAIGMVKLLSTDPGWAVISATTSENGTCSNEFTFHYYLGDSGISATAENKKLTSTYTELCENAYRIFNSDSTFSDVGNIASLNKHPNEAIEIDSELYAALEKIASSDNRGIYLGPVYGYYQSLFNSADDNDAADFDPFVSDELKEYYKDVAAFAADSEQVSVELLSDSRAILHVSDEYSTFAEENVIKTYISLFWMKNAFVADYLAASLEDAGYTKGVLSSYDGFSRTLGDMSGGTENGETYSLNIYARLDKTVYSAAVLGYGGRRSTVVLKDFPVAESDTLNYYVTGNGDVRFPYAGVSDGLSRAATPFLAAYSEKYGCADVLLQTAPIYIADSLDADRLEKLSQNGIYSVWCDGERIMHTEKDISLRNLYSDSAVTFKEN